MSKIWKIAKIVLEILAYVIEKIKPGKPDSTNSQKN